MSNLIKPIGFNAENGDQDSQVPPRSLQLLSIAHRTALMNVSGGDYPDAAGHFGAPAGVSGYTGFGANGIYYTNGVQGRTWSARQCIDDFSDKVTDTFRWEAIGDDLFEGGIDALTNPPFGLRLSAEYAGTGVEVYDRKGRMVFSHPASGNVASLSCRVSTRQGEAALGSGIENCILLGMQKSSSDVDYLFAGFCNTTTYPRSVVYGHVIAGVATVSGSVAIAADLEEVEIAIQADSSVNQYRGFYSTDTSAEDLVSGANWNPIGVAVAFPAGYPTDLQPRIHAGFPLGDTLGEVYSMTDVRVEENSGTWAGDQYASWYLEVSDATNPAENAGTTATCPNEILAVWERETTGGVTISLIDSTDPTAPKLWRRWQSIGNWTGVSNASFPFKSYGQLDATEGHIVFTHDSTDKTGEVWLLSLRWDKVFVYTVNGIKTFPVYFNAGGRVLREANTWGSRRWIDRGAYTDLVAYDQSYQPSTDFAGTLAKIGTESIVDALTYDVDLRRGDDGKMYLAYGIQESVSAGSKGETFAGVILLGEDASFTQTRWLFRKNTASGLTTWGMTASPVGVALNGERCLYWLQEMDRDAYGECFSYLCRKDFSAVAGNNASSATITEDDYWGGVDVFPGHALDVHLLDSDPLGDEQLCITAGNIVSSKCTYFRYDSGTPGNSTISSYGPIPDGRGVDYSWVHQMPMSRYPEWFEDITVAEDLSLKECRLGFSRAQGSDGFISTIDGRGISYLAWDGTIAREREFRTLRGKAIERGDFTLQFTARVTPPFAAGYGFAALNSMAATQFSSLDVGVIGPWYEEARVGFLWKGNQSLNGGIFANSFIRSLTVSGGVSSAVNETELNSWAWDQGLQMKVRLRRAGGTIFCDVWDGALATWVNYLNESFPEVPVVPFIKCSCSDNVGGLPASQALELERLELAPSDSPFGSVHQRLVDHNVLRSTLGHVISGVTNRNKIPTSSSGSLVIADSWAFVDLAHLP